MTGVQFEHPREPSKASADNSLENIGYAVLPLLLTIVLLIFFIASGKLF